MDMIVLSKVGGILGPFALILGLISLTKKEGGQR